MPSLWTPPRLLAAALLAVLVTVAGCTGQATTTPQSPLPPTVAPTAAPKAVVPTAAPKVAAPKAVAPTTAPTAAPKAVAPTAAPTAAPKAVAPTTVPKAVGPLTPTNLAAMPKVDVLVSGLDTPWAIDFAPDGRIFVTERGGKIRTIKDGQLNPEPWLTLDVAEVGESGLMGLALDPNFAQNRYLYTTYTYRQGNQLFNRLVRLRDDPASGKGVEDKILVDAVPTNTTHSGGRVRFGPDGKLYWTMGDAQQTQLAQNPSSLLGKVMRLNPDGSAPSDNPFPNSIVYSVGHRNPQGLAWQPGTNRLYETEHGPSGGQGAGQDEVNLIEPGQNYGWPTITGDQTREGLVSPVAHSGTNTTWAPGGAAFVTQGPWQGALVFVGLRGQSLYRVVLDPTDPRKVQQLTPLLQGQYGRLRDIQQGPDGALYVTTSNLDGRGNPPRDGDKVLRLTF